METYEIITLVDITRTQARREDADLLKKSQQSNFNSLQQTIELRSNVEWNTDPVPKYGEIPADSTVKKARYWRWQFNIERELVFSDGVNPVALLLEDLHSVPVINGLTETVKLAPSAFFTHGCNTNTWVIKI